MRKLLSLLFVIVLAGSSLAGPASQSQPAISLDTAKIDKYMLERIEADKFPSLSIGVVYDQQLLYAKAYGVADRKTNRPASPETIYRIGSVTKVFTTTLMCMLRDKGLIRLDDPVGKYLPEGVQLPSDPRGEPVITLRHLATHSSGLPRLTPNVAAKGEDAYGGYTVEQLYAGLAETPLIYPTGAKSVYSNLGVGLLGHVLERAAGQPYETLLKKHLLEPLGMKDTTMRCRRSSGSGSPCPTTARDSSTRQRTGTWAAWCRAAGWLRRCRTWRSSSRC